MTIYKTATHSLCNQNQPGRKKSSTKRYTGDYILFLPLFYGLLESLLLCYCYYATSLKHVINTSNRVSAVYLGGQCQQPEGESPPGVIKFSPPGSYALSVLSLSKSYILYSIKCEMESIDCVSSGKCQILTFTMTIMRREEQKCLTSVTL